MITVLICLLMVIGFIFVFGQVKFTVTRTKPEDQVETKPENGLWINDKKIF